MVETGQGFLCFSLQTRRRSELVLLSITTSLRAALASFHIWLRHWVYGPHGRKSTIGELPETGEEVVSQRRGLGGSGSRLGRGALLWHPGHEDIVCHKFSELRSYKIIEVMVRLTVKKTQQREATFPE